MSTFSAYLPQQEGLLPYFLLLQGILAWTHTIACYASPPNVSLRQFSGPRAPPPHPLLAHVYGIKNLYSGAIRLYAAYNISSPPMYNLAIWSFVGVLILYVAEVFVYRHSNLREVFIPYILSGGGLVWLWLQRDYYVVQ